MKKENIISIVLLVLSAVLAVVSFIILPDTVVIQFSVAGSNTTTAPKLIAVMIPAALGIGGSLFSLFFNDNKGKRKSLIVSAVGIVVFIIMFVVNLSIK